jgi:serine protease Do
MMRRLAPVAFVLTTIVGFLVGFTVRPRHDASAGRAVAAGPASVPSAAAPAAGSVASVVNFAEVAARLNPAVVNVEAASRARLTPTGERQAPQRDPFDDEPGDDESADPEDPDLPDEGSGSGFIVESDGHILTNHHVISGADRVTVKLADGRSLRAVVIGSDPATDIALIKVDAGSPLPVAPMGDSSGVRVGEWVCAIGNPLAYEHTVTVGVVSFLGRKLFDASLDDYIQTDAAINFGSSGGPLINARGEVIGMNAAISRKARNIGFAIPINQARAILPQLKADGRVARGYLGVTLRDLDPDLSKSLGLSPTSGALVQDVTEGSPGARAGIRPYDVIVSVDGTRVRSNDDLIRHIAARAPGIGTTLQVLRDGRELAVSLRLGERPSTGEDERARPAPARSTPRPADTPSIALGVSVRELDRSLARRLHVPDGMRGVVVSAVDPLGPAYEAGVERGDIILEVNRVEVPTPADYVNATRTARPGDVLAFFCYLPDLGQRALRAVRVEASQE